jgi:hypothetical protein
MSHNGQHAPSPDRRTRRIRMVVVVATAGAIALAIGLFLGSRSDDGSSATPSPVASGTPSPSAEPTSSEEPTPSEEPTSTEEPAVASGFADGRHFVLAESVKPGDVLVADLGYFFTGDEANEAAAGHGVETPVPNDYFIVNDNPKLRRVPISTDATVRYIPSESCCDLQPWDLQTWIDAVNGEVQTDMMGEMSFTWWWITVRGGAVVAIEQQYIP